MRLTLIAAALAATALTTACGKMSAPATSPAATAAPAAASAAPATSPTVAKVNGHEIHEAEIGAVLARLGNIPADKVKEAGKQVLDKLIDEELILEQAKDKKVDADPKVAQALEAARKEVLIRAYLDQATASVTKPTDFEIKDFFEKNPALFKDRKIYNLRELQVAAKPDLLPKLEAVVNKAKSIEEVAKWLKDQNQPFNATAAAKPAEQLPLELLPRFAAMKDGQLVLVNTGAILLVEQLLGSRAQPVDEATAKPVIERVLTTQKRGEAASKEVKTQREKAKIEYLGDYASAQPAPAVAPVRPN